MGADCSGSKLKSLREGVRMCVYLFIIIIHFHAVCVCMVQAGYPESADGSAKLGSAVFPCVHACCKDTCMRTHTQIHAHKHSHSNTPTDPINTIFVWTFIGVITKLFPEPYSFQLTPLPQPRP